MINLSPEARKKLEFINGHSIARDFPNTSPTLEWVGAVLDLLELLHLNQMFQPEPGTQILYVQLIDNVIYYQDNALERRAGDKYIGTGLAGPNVFKWDKALKEKYPELTGRIVKEERLR